jgi:hypothetical protein
MFQLWRYLHAIRDARGIDSDQKALLTIGLIAFRDSQTGNITPSYQQIADALDWSRAKVVRRVAALRDSGILTVLGGGGRSRSSTFTIDLAKVEALKPAHLNEPVSTEKPAHLNEPVSDPETGSSEIDTGSSGGLNRLTQMSHSEDLFSEKKIEEQQKVTAADVGGLWREEWTSRYPDRRFNKPNTNHLETIAEEANKVREPWTPTEACFYWMRTYLACEYALVASKRHPLKLLVDFDDRSQFGTLPRLEMPKREPDPEGEEPPLKPERLRLLVTAASPIGGPFGCRAEVVEKAKQQLAALSPDYTDDEICGWKAEQKARRTRVYQKALGWMRDDKERVLRRPWIQPPGTPPEQPKETTHAQEGHANPSEMAPLEDLMSDLAKAKIRAAS